uniref:Uncharacterized protein n=1 Tax=Globodera rostochiensis TaxID=31243 RepID=A0A914I6J5_GLORO
MVPLTTALSKLLNCKAENLAEYLNNPEAVNKASVYLTGKTLKTTYLSRDGTTKQSCWPLTRVPKEATRRLKTTTTWTT